MAGRSCARGLSHLSGQSQQFQDLYHVRGLHLDSRRTDPAIGFFASEVGISFEVERTLTSFRSWLAARLEDTRSLQGPTVRHKRNQNTLQPDFREIQKQQRFPPANREKFVTRYSCCFQQGFKIVDILRLCSHFSRANSVPYWGNFVPFFLKRTEGQREEPSCNLQELELMARKKHTWD